MKLRMSTSGWILAFAIMASGSAGYDQVPPAEKEVALKWLIGKCQGCKTATGLAEIRFTTDADAWATGYNFGPEGTGDYVVVHTEDGGRSWRELPQTYQHAGPPAFSFSTPDHGWITWWNPADKPQMIMTADGGKHWEIVSDTYLRLVRFFDDLRGVGALGTAFYRTANGGKAWTKVEIPHIQRIDRLLFLSPEVGWLAGTDGRDLFVFRTVDGGSTWEEARAHVPDRIGNVADLYFLDRQRGWVITWHGDDAGTYLLKTTDGGKSWTRDADESIQGPHKWDRVVRFLSEEKGFVFETSEAPACDGCGPASHREDRERSLMVITDDGGSRWRRTILPDTVYDCQIFRGDLRCSGAGRQGGFNVLTLHVR